ncbi:MAG TPA: hypothetical protein VFF27_13865 [Bacteroidia bacterium]|jgi:hypothetical protein|nr:hypothetical protein [Bacteroidia bacterium]
MNENNQTIVEKVELRTSIISLREDGLVQMDTKEVDDFLLQDAMDCAAVIKRLAGSKKVAVLSNIRYYITMDKDVREFWASEQLENYISCEAFVIENVSMKMITKFYILFNKPKRPSQIFSTEKSALSWLKEVIA